jgi:hypothetical protein
MKENPMSTVQVLHDEIQAFDPEAAEKFKGEMVAAMMDAPLKNFTSLRGVATAWADKRDFLKKMQDPAFRAMAVGVVAEEYGMELPIEAELEVLSAQEDAADDAENTEKSEPSFS